MDQNLKRGIDLQNRLWDDASHRAQKLFEWWKGGKISKYTFLLITVLLLLNMYSTFPILGKDVSKTFVSSTSLFTISKVFGLMGIAQRTFFTILILCSLNFSVITCYLFVRRIVHRHELTAFLSTLFFILPNPFFNNEPSLVSAFLLGDGAHVLAFSLMPLLLLYIHSFVIQGLGIWALIGAIGSVLIAVISPFAFFNVLIFSFIITISEGFMGDLRLKLARLTFLIVVTFGLSLFWYYPHVYKRIIFSGDIPFVLGKLWSVFPVLVPIVPVFGVLSFLIFDKRAKLKPIFIGFSLCFIYLFLSIVSKVINASGTFAADRYVIELYFVVSFLIPILLAIFIEFFYKRRKLDIFWKNPAVSFTSIAASSFVVFFILLLLFYNTQQARASLVEREIVGSQVPDGIWRSSTVIGGTDRGFSLFDFGFDFALLISSGTVYVLIVVVRKLATTVREEIA